MTNWLLVYTLAGCCYAFVAFVQKLPVVAHTPAVVGVRLVRLLLRALVAGAAWPVMLVVWWLDRLDWTLTDRFLGDNPRRRS